MFIARAVEPWEVINLLLNIKGLSVTQLCASSHFFSRFFIQAAGNSAFVVASAKSYSIHIQRSLGVVVFYFCCLLRSLLIPFGVSSPNSGLQAVETATTQASILRSPE